MTTDETVEMSRKRPFVTFAVVIVVGLMAAAVLFIGTVIEPETLTKLISIK
jgi:hypothetical protein